MTLHTCKWRECGRSMLSQRADAEFCSDACRSRYKNERRRQGTASTTRVSAQESGAGSRGGNVRDLNEARGLQEEQKEKARWTLIVREHIARTLLETGYFHCDDLDALGVPPAHCNVKGSQIGSFRSRGLMEKTGQERKVSHVAANGRRAPIHRISAKGRKELSKMLVGAGREREGGKSGRAISGSSPCSGENTQLDNGVLKPQGPGGDFTPSLPVDDEQGASRVRDRGEPGPGNRGSAQEPAIDGSAAVKASGSASPDQLFELGPDRPRSAWTDPETAEAA